MVKHCLSILVLVLVLGCTKENKETQPRPNILFIMSDDHAFQAISAYDSKLIFSRDQLGLSDVGISKISFTCALARDLIFFCSSNTSIS